MGGHAVSMMQYAIPDCGVFTATEMIDQAGRVAAALTIPLIVDADQAGESVADVFRSVKSYQRAGVAGIHIEDEITPKHSTWDGPLMPIADMQARIAAAIKAHRPGIRAHCPVRRALRGRWRRQWLARRDRPTRHRLR